MEIYLIRHTTPDIAPGICYGQSNIALADSFPEEAQKVLSQLPVSFENVYSSPLHRCLKLAEQLPASHLQTDSRLMELNFGEWEMKAWDELPQSELDAWMRNYVHVAPPKGESMQTLQERVLACWKEIIAEPAGTIAVVTHAGVIRIIRATLAHIPLMEVFSEIQVPYGAVWKYTP